MDDRQALALKVAPIHPALFFVIVRRAGRIDARNLQLDTDQSDGCETETKHISTLWTDVK